VPAAPRRLRADWPFSRLALVLSGGGALGAYEIGVLRALEAVGLKPPVVVGVSVGAINAVSWIAHGFRSEGLARVWSTLRPASIGMRWTTLTLRLGGLLVAAVAMLEVVLALADLPELGLAGLYRRPVMSHAVRSIYLETLAWQITAVAALSVVVFSRSIEDLFARLAHSPDPAKVQRWSGRALLGAALLYVAALALGLPWPSRFHLILLLAGTAAWFLNRPGSSSDRVRRLLLRLLPETGGRGLWRTSARRRLIERFVAEGDAERLLDPATSLIVTACEVETGRMAYLVNGRDPHPEFRARMEEAFGEVIVLRAPLEVVEAAVASSAIPVVFEPVLLQGRAFVDAGLFSNQPLHAALAAGADALLLVLVSPSAGPAGTGREADLLELGVRMLDVANWRDLQTELRQLPHDWRTGGTPSTVAIVEPDAPLPGSQLGFEPAIAGALMARGEADAWAALERAGWLAPADTPVAP
jgi:predicted acylesterase/phospholipase RssA